MQSTVKAVEMPEKKKDDKQGKGSHGVVQALGYKRAEHYITNETRV